MPRPAASVRGGAGRGAGDSAAPGGDGATVRPSAVGGRRPTVTVAPGRWCIRGVPSACRRSAPPGRARAATAPGATGRAGRGGRSCLPAPAIRRGPGRWVAGIFPNFAGDFPAVGPGGAPFAPGRVAVRRRPPLVPALRSPHPRAPPPKGRASPPGPASRRQKAAATGLSPVKTGIGPVKTGLGPVFGARIGVGGRTLAGGAGPAFLSET